MLDGWFDRLLAAIQDTKDAGVSARALSMRAGLNDQYVGQMVRNNVQPTVDKFIALCEAMNVDPIAILTGAKGDPDTTKAVHLFSTMSPDQRKAFLAILSTMKPDDSHANTAEVDGEPSSAPASQSH
ncbi:XRE family transcriptional regulator [Roseibium sp. RKSG952]|nr:XRE family transcriptional regulator [Roseibium sp. RKSG952]